MEWDCSKCLICSKDGEGDSEEDRKPVLVGDTKWREWKGAFRCFCEVGGIEGNKVEGLLEELEPSLLDVQGEEVVWRVPTCELCSGGLGEVLRLQKCIEELKSEQNEQMETLQRLLVCGENCGAEQDSAWNSARKQLITCFVQKCSSELAPPPQVPAACSAVRPPSSGRLPNILRRKLRQTAKTLMPEPVSVEYILPDDTSYFADNPDDVLVPSESSRDPLLNEDVLENVTSAPKPKTRKFIVRKTTSAKAVALIAPPKPEVRTVRPCTVKLKRLNPAKIKKEVDEPEDLRAVSSTRKSKMKAMKFLKQTLQQSSRSPSPSGNDNDQDFNFEDALLEDYEPQEKHIEEENLEEDEGSEKSRGSSPVPNYSDLGSYTQYKKGRHFYLINDHFLLFKSTLVQVSDGGTKLTCMETGCSFETQNVSNWTRAFNEMQYHLETDHQQISKRAKHQTLLCCPLCPEKLETGARLRKHILSKAEHAVENVPCEVCWKPIKHVGDNYKMHMWRHGSQREKEDNAPQQVKYKAKACGAYKKYVSGTSRKGKVPQNIKAPVLKPQLVKKIDKRKKCRKEIPEKRRRTEGPTLAMTFLKETLQQSSRSPSPSEHFNDQDFKIEDEEPEKSPGSSPVPNYSDLGSYTQYKKGRHFYLINDHFLLFKSTLVQVSDGGTKLTCMETGCSFETQNVSNWTRAFNQMQHHLETDHQQISRWAKRQTLLCCPLCPEKLETGAGLRKHIFSKAEHAVENVACEVCWRPIRHSGDNYRMHIWRHGSQREKEDNAPQQVKYKAKACGAYQKYVSGISRKDKALQKQPQNIKAPALKPEVESKPQLVKKIAKRTPEKRRKTEGPSLATKISYFSKLGENLLLYKYSLIRITPGEGLFCEELGCDKWIARNTDYDLLEMAKQHVETCHILEKVKEYSEIGRTCPLCPEDIFKGIDFRKHLIKEHRGVCKYTCQSCGKPFTALEQGRRHDLLHRSPEEKAELGLKEKPEVVPKAGENFVCCQCGKNFSTKYYLKAHELLHVPKHLRKKQHICDICGDSLCDAKGLRNHIERLHRPDMIRYRYCPICNQRFNWRDGYRLRIHLRRHRNERPFVCDQCGKAFLSREQIQRHQQKVHVDTRVYQCEFCEMNYKHPGNLKRHRESAHKDKVQKVEVDPEVRLKSINPAYRPDFIGPRIAYPCPVCEKVFQLRSRMTKHLKKCHGD